MPAKPDPAPPAWSSFVYELNVRTVGTTVALAVAAALILSPAFIIPFGVLLGRTMFLALVLLLAYAAGRAWPRSWAFRWLPPAMAPPVAVATAAPLATLLVYLFASGGSVESFIRVPERVMGFFLIAGFGIIFGLLTTLGAHVRERLAKARAQALEFELERSRLEKQSVDAKLALLQAQIEPHFLFNTLANVQALVESNSPRAADVLKSLIAYLRAAMPRLREEAPTLGAEIALVRAYLELMRMRIPDRLRFTIVDDPALAARRFPPLALMTLVENAVQHGIDPFEAGGTIEVGVRAEGPGMRLWVSDTGAGMDPRAHPGTGLVNLGARLHAFFGPSATLQLEEQSPHGLRAEIVIAA